MNPAFNIRSITRQDYAGWRPLWDGYNAFYGRAGETALAEEVTRETWRRFFDPAQRVFALSYNGFIVYSREL